MLSRRKFFAAMVPATAAAGIGMASDTKPQRARAVLTAACPLCGLHVMYTDRVFDKPMDYLHRVQCGCGWRGVAMLTCVVDGK